MFSVSQSPVKLYTQSGTSVASTKKSPAAANLQFYSSAQPLVVSDALFRCQQTCEQNHTECLKVTESEVILRRGNTLILKITTSIELSGGYIVSLTFVPVFRPRDRFGQFRADGEAKGTRHLWLSIAIPSSFPVGKYHGHITLALKGRVELVTYFHNKAIVILFNPWDKGKLDLGTGSPHFSEPCCVDDDTYLSDEVQRKAYLLDDVGVIWRGSEAQKLPLYWQYGQVGLVFK